MDTNKIVIKVNASEAMTLSAAIVEAKETWKSHGAKESDYDIRELTNINEEIIGQLDAGSVNVA